MAKISIHFPMKGLRIDPDAFEQLEVDDKAIQTLAAMFGWDGDARRLITCASRGSMYSVSPAVHTIMNEASVAPGENMTFDNLLTTEVMIMANSANTGDVWVNVGVAAAVDTGWPLHSGDIVTFSINNMKDLHIHVVTSGDKVIIVRAG